MILVGSEGKSYGLENYTNFDLRWCMNATNFIH